MKKSLSIIAVIAFLAVSCGMLPTYVEHNGTKIEYSKGATKEEAIKLNAYLDSIDYTDGRRADVKLSKNGENYNVKIIVKDDYDLDKKNKEIMQEFACEMSKIVFGGKTVDLDICNNTWVKKFDVQSKDCDQFAMVGKESKKYGSVEIYFGESITEKQLSDVSDYVLDLFGKRTPRTFSIDKVDGRGVFSIIILDRIYYDDPEKKDDYRIIACDLTKILGYDTDVHMCDEYMKTQEIVEPSKCDK